MSETAKKLEFENKENSIPYGMVKNKFSVIFLQNVLSKEIEKLVELQNNTATLLEEMIEDLKRMPLNGG